MVSAVKSSSMSDYKKTAEFPIEEDGKISRQILDDLCGNTGSKSELDLEKLKLDDLCSFAPTQRYLDQLINDKNELRNFDNLSFKHVNKLIDQEISRVISLLSSHMSASESASEEIDDRGDKVTLTEIIMVPVEKYPRYNFVGRILGPRGMTAKQLEDDTGCKIMVRGRGSSRMYQGVRRERGNDSEPLHVLIQCEDSPARAEAKMQHAIDEINQLLNPPPEGKDELKRKQLIELSIINGTYRPTTSTKNALQVPRPSSAAHLHSAVDQFSDSETLSSLIDRRNSTSPVKRSVVNDGADRQQLASVAQLLGLLSPMQASASSMINQSLTADYYKNLLAFSLTDPNMMSALMSASQSMDPYGVPLLASQPSGSIPQANLQQYMQAAAMLNSVPFAHDGSGDTPKTKRH